ncbi:hypothetical protein CAPTEDRAFT_186514 [Capitella teleta]|uniref:C-type lectin domain-containing protein n=1 Tax=Capitella teleta TaxID=283909 RepID=R7VAV0_CAPTE|nr:hypothetical protein CAPTEDRAFT_186514 [Capitella teleta]|eukprot:ELU12830.1 hypothetical protein CAPTEDRAFT_186514 [Capitella teleta]
MGLIRDHGYMLRFVLTAGLVAWKVSPNVYLQDQANTLDNQGDDYDLEAAQLACLATASCRMIDYNRAEDTGNLLTVTPVTSLEKVVTHENRDIWEYSVVETGTPYMTRIDGYALHNPLNRKVMVITEQQCVDICLNHQEIVCRAINFKDGNCDLSRLTKAMDPGNFNEESGSVYIEIERLSSTVWQEHVNITTDNFFKNSVNQTQEDCRRLCVNYPICRRLEYSFDSGDCLLGQATLADIPQNVTPVYQPGFHVYDRVTVDFAKGYCGGGGWIQRGSFCYLANCTPSSHDEAVERCGANGAVLASIHDLNEQLFIQWLGRDAMRNDGGLTCGIYQGLTIGLTSSATNTSAWKWEDGSPLDYLAWDQDEPNDVDEYCVFLHIRARTNGLQLAWYDVECSVHIGYVCKKGITLVFAKCASARENTWSEVTRKTVVLKPMTS